MESSLQKNQNEIELPIRENQNKIGLPPKMTQYERRIMTLPKIIGKFKMQSAKEINLTRGTTGTPVWQKNYYEHIIRNDKDLQNIRNYIENNPMKWYEDEENKHK